MLEECGSQSGLPECSWSAEEHCATVDLDAGPVERQVASLKEAKDRRNPPEALFTTHRAGFPPATRKTHAPCCDRTDD